MTNAPNTPDDNATPAPQTPPPGPDPAQGAPAPDAPAGLVSAESADAKTMGMLAHLLAIFTLFVGPLIMWLVKKDESPFVDQQGKEALNWALTITTGLVGCIVLLVIPIIQFLACLVWPAIGVCNIVFGILSTIAVNSGQPYRYPVCIRFIK